MTTEAHLLLWSIDETAGFDSAWASIEGERLRAEGRACGLLPTPYWLAYVLETEAGYVTRRMQVESRWHDGSATLDLVRGDGGWLVDGEPRPDLDGAIDCDLAACPLTNTMPILRHRLQEGSGDVTLLMAFIEVPGLQVVPSRQRYTHIGPAARGGAVVRYRSGSFESDLTVDSSGFVIEYPQLGRRVEAGKFPEGIRASGAGSVRPA